MLSAYSFVDILLLLLFFYSTVFFRHGGYQGESSKACDWTLVEKVKRINATCQDALVNRALVEHGGDCFTECGASQRWG
jgi:hypothetical protein